MGMMSEPAGSLCDGSVAACSLSSSGKLDLSCGARFETPGLCKGGYKAPLFGFLCLGILFNTKKKKSCLTKDLDIDHHQYQISFISSSQNLQQSGDQFLCV